MHPPTTAAEFLCPECERVFGPGEERCPYDGTRLVNLGAGLAGGTVIDNRYTIRRLLGKGGMGSVYVARQHSMDRDVAIKIMHHRADGNQASVQRFFWEVRAARRLQSQHTITVFDFGQTERGSLYLAMELLKGTTLGHRLSLEEMLPVTTVVRYATQICRSLEEAHSHGIIHRDLKPENIFLVQRSGQRAFVKVLDFGVAKFLDPDGGIPLTQTGTVFGTPRYMSPEQANSEPVDARSDLYSLGILVYEMLTGRVPFAEDNPLEILYKHVHALPLPLIEAAPGLVIDPRIPALVDRLLAKRREDRPASAVEVRAELEACLETLPEEPGEAILAEEFDSGLPTPLANAATGTSDTYDALEAGSTLRAVSPTPSLGVRRDSGSALYRIVGRRNEQLRAKKALDEALRGAPRFLWVAGEAGLGKQRFSRWLAEVAKKEHRALVARGLRSASAGTAGSDLRTLVDDVLGTTLLERTALRIKLEEHPALSDQIEPDLIEALARFLRPNLAPDQAEPPVGREIFSALLRLFIRVARLQPVVIEAGRVDDGDPTTRAFLEYLATSLPSQSVRIAVVLRVDTPPGQRQVSLGGLQESIGWRAGAEGRLHELVTLQRLEGSEFAELTQTIGRGFGHLTPYLLYLSGGNPADATDLVTAIEQNPEHLRMAKTWNPVGLRVPLSELPPSIVDRAARHLNEATTQLAGLPEAVAVTRHAAMHGLEFDPLLLEQSLERDGQTAALDAVERVLDTLVRSGCLIEVPATGRAVPRLRFASGVLRELVLAQVRSPRAVRRLHQMVAETLEAFHGEAPRALELAGHWEGADALDKALGYRLTYARAARAGGRQDEAAAGFAQVLDTAQRIEAATPSVPQPAADAAAREALRVLGQLRADLGTYEAAADAFRGLLERAAKQGDALETAQAELALADVYDALAEYGAASELLRAASERYRGLGRHVDAARCELRRAASIERRGQTKAAREAYEAARRVFAQHQDTQGLADTYHAQGLLSLREGDAAEALRQLRRAVDLHQKLDVGLARAKVLHDLALAATERREYVLALDAAQKALDLFDREGHRMGVSQALGTVARVLLAQHRPAEARPFFEKALRTREDLGDRRGVGEAVGALAAIALDLDQPERAVELAQRSREIFASSGDFVGAAAALRTSGAAEAALGRFDNALALLNEGIATYQSLGKADVGLCAVLESLGDCQVKMGLTQDAVQSLGNALTVARELKAAHVIAHLEARLRGLGTGLSHAS